ncbi:MAG: hypothetical protein E7379_00895 [Clostridiales bacterium]|nr:hypothetical protein [Clostridiales bacterium]
MNTQLILFALLFSSFFNGSDLNLNNNTLLILLLLLSIGNNNSCGCGCTQNTCPNNFNSNTFI